MAGYYSQIVEILPFKSEADANTIRNTSLLLWSTSSGFHFVLLSMLIVILFHLLPFYPLKADRLIHCILAIHSVLTVLCCSGGDFGFSFTSLFLNFYDFF